MGTANYDSESGLGITDNDDNAVDMTGNAFVIIYDNEASYDLDASDGAVDGLDISLNQSVAGAG